MMEIPYIIIGYKGKQVRDIIHASDVIHAFDMFFQNPRIGEAYNIGGGRESNVSVLEAIEVVQEITSRKIQVSYVEQNRLGDHIWYVSDLSKLKAHYPDWKLRYNSVRLIAEEIYALNKDR